VLTQSGLVFDEWLPVDKLTLKTRFPHVYAIGDMTSSGTPKAGLFVIGAARAAAESILAEYKGYEYSGNMSGEGSCYVEFGEGRVARVNVDFFSGPVPIGTHHEASIALSAEKNSLEQHHTGLWFGKSA